MIVTEADDTVEMLLQKLEADGHDMTLMREARSDLSMLPVGDPTPVPGSLLLEPTLVVPAAVHQGLNDTPEGPFYLPPFGAKPGRHYSVADLRRKITRLQYWVAGLWMFVISLVVVLWVRW